MRVIARHGDFRQLVRIEQFGKGLNEGHVVVTGIFGHAVLEGCFEMEPILRGSLVLEAVIREVTRGEKPHRPS